MVYIFFCQKLAVFSDFLVFSLWTSFYYSYYHSHKHTPPGTHHAYSNRRHLTHLQETTMG